MRSQRAQLAPGVRDQIRFSKILPFVMSQKADFQIGAFRMHFSEEWSGVKEVKDGLFLICEEFTDKQGEQVIVRCTFSTAWGL